MSLPKFNAKTASKIVGYVEAGNYMAVAATASGITYTTLKRWLQRGKDPNAPKSYRAFRAEIKRARAQAELTAIQNIRTAGLDPRHWQANAWFLERSGSRERWRPPTTRTEVQNSTPTPADALKEAETRAEDYRPPEADPEADE